MTSTPARLADPTEAVLAARELAPRMAARAARYDQAGAFPDEDFADLRAAGLLGLLEAAGTSASRRGHPLERIFRDARCGALQPATSDVCADWLGVAALGADPDNQAGIARW
jgi:alkylation response protein AidB-like acyl-CoA dehydrogenase